MSMQGLNAAADTVGVPDRMCLQSCAVRVHRGSVREKDLRGSSSHCAACRGISLKTSMLMCNHQWCLITSCCCPAARACVHM